MLKNLNVALKLSASSASLTFKNIFERKLKKMSINIEAKEADWQTNKQTNKKQQRQQQQQQQHQH